MFRARVAVIGGGPAGLYAARLIKLADPTTEVVLHERTSADTRTFGFGVGLTESTMNNLYDADPVTAEHIRAVSHSGHNLVLRRRHGGEHRDVMLHGARNLAVGRAELLAVLAEAAVQAGVDYRRGSRVDLADVDADVVIAADGVRSAVRAKLSAELGVHETLGRGRYLWCGSDFAVDSAYFTARRSGDALFVVHAYPYTDQRSTFLIEADDHTWTAASLDANDKTVAAGESDVASIALLQKLFDEDLRGRPLLANRSRWARFSTLALNRWSTGNVVLIGDAAHTAHYTLGSGTKLALEDAIALAHALATHNDLPTAFADYEHARRPAIDRFKQLASRSQRWWESFRLRVDQPAEQIALSYMTRAGNLTIADYARQHPDVVAAALRALGPNPPSDPAAIDDWVLAQPLRRHGFQLSQRSVAVDGSTAGTRVESIVWSEPDVWSETADHILKPLHRLAEDTVVEVRGGADAAAVNARLDFAERINLQFRLPTVVRVPRSARSHAAAAIAAGRCDAVIFGE